MGKESLAKELRWHLGWVCAVGALAGFIYIIVYVFSNPEMTETQVFIAKWPAIILNHVLLGVATMCLLPLREKKRNER